MTRTFDISSLRHLLLLDAAICAGTGVGLTLTAQLLAVWTALPAPLLFWAGVLLLPIAAFMALSARPRVVAQWAATVVIGGNVAWVLASFAVPLFASVAPNLLGWTLLCGQAVFVAVMAVLETSASRRSAMSV